MEATFKHFRYIDLATLTSSGQKKLIDVYKKLLHESPKQNKQNEISDFAKKIKELSIVNERETIQVGKNIDITKLTDNL